MLLTLLLHQGSEKPGFFKKPHPSIWVFLVLFAFEFYWVFVFCYPIEQMGSLFYLAHQLSFLFRFTSTLDYLEIHKFITYWSLEAVNVKKSLIITGVTN